MTIATNSPDRVRYRPVLVDIGRRFTRSNGDASRPALGGAQFPGSAAIVMRGWRPRAVEIANPAQPLWMRLARVAVTAFRRVAEWQERAHTRQDLLRLDDHALRDIGLTRLGVQRHVNKPFWRV